MCGQREAAAKIYSLTYDRQSSKVVVATPPSELCIAMIKQSTLSGEAIPKAILFRDKKLKLPLEKLVGQGYDECSALYGKFNEAQAIIKESYPQAVCVHYVSGSHPFFSVTLIFLKTKFAYTCDPANK